MANPAQAALDPHLRGDERTRWVGANAILSKPLRCFAASHGQLGYTGERRRDFVRSGHNDWRPTSTLVGQHTRSWTRDHQGRFDSAAGRTHRSGQASQALLGLADVDRIAAAADLGQTLEQGADLGERNRGEFGQTRLSRDSTHLRLRHVRQQHGAGRRRVKRRRTTRARPQSQPVVTLDHRNVHRSILFEDRQTDDLAGFRGQAFHDRPSLLAQAHAAQGNSAKLGEQQPQSVAL